MYIEQAIRFGHMDIFKNIFDEQYPLVYEESKAIFLEEQATTAARYGRLDIFKFLWNLMSKKQSATFCRAIFESVDSDGGLMGSERNENDYEEICCLVVGQLEEQPYPDFVYGVLNHFSTPKFVKTIIDNPNLDANLYLILMLRALSSKRDCESMVVVIDHITDNDDNRKRLIADFNNLMDDDYFTSQFKIYCRHPAIKAYIEENCSMIFQLFRRQVEIISFLLDYTKTNNIDISSMIDHYMDIVIGIQNYGLYTILMADGRFSFTTKQIDYMRRILDNEEIIIEDPNSIPELYFGKWTKRIKRAKLGP